MVIVTRPLAEEFIFALEQWVGPQDNVAGEGPGLHRSGRRHGQAAPWRSWDRVGEVDRFKGVCWFDRHVSAGTAVPIFAISIRWSAKVEVIAGINLPMLIKLASVRGTESCPTRYAAARDAGQKYINVAVRPAGGEAVMTDAEANGRAGRRPPAGSRSPTAGGCTPGRRRSSSRPPGASRATVRLRERRRGRRRQHHGADDA